MRGMSRSRLVARPVTVDEGIAPPASAAESGRPPARSRLPEPFLSAPHRTALASLPRTRLSSDLPRDGLSRRPSSMDGLMTGSSRMMPRIVSAFCTLHTSRSGVIPITGRPSPCARLSRVPWPVVTPATTMAAPSPWPSRAVGDPVVRRHHTSEAEVGAPLIPFLGFTSQCPPREGATASRFMLSHGSAAVVRRFFRRVVTFTPEDGDSSRVAFTMSAGSNATCCTAPSGRRAVLPACSCPGGLSAAG
jgi:hypothetical protein